jgi:type I restriction enzyme, S subunit
MTLYRFDQIAENIRVPVMPKPKDSERYIGLEHMDSGSLRIRRWGAQTDLIGQKLTMKEGDVLFARRNAYLRRVAIAPFDGVFSAHGMVLRAKTDVCLHEFLPVFMESDYFMERAIKISVGSLSPTINWSALQKEEFELPPVDEQRRIADLLWAADDAISHYISLYKSLSDLSKSYLYRWLSVINQQFEFGDFPYKAKFIRIGSIAPCTVPGRNKPKSFTGTIPWITTPDISSSVFISSNAANKVDRQELLNAGGKTVPSGTVLMTCVGELGITTLVREEASFNQQIHAFTPNNDIVPEYLVFALKAQKRQMLSRAATTTVPYLNKENCDSLVIPYPDKEIQIKVGNYLLELEKIANEISSHIDSLKLLKQKLLSNMLAVADSASK